jgi:flavin-dependent dehydrogenase
VRGGAADYDVAIAGGGPAGAAAALALLRTRPGLRVAVIEASAFEGWRAGETLAPGGREILAGLGCWERVRDTAVACHGTRAVWGGDEPYDNEFVFSARGNGWHLDRVRFDAALLDTARAAGAVVFLRARIGASARLRDGTWLLAIENGPDTLTARRVIDATGRAASFAARQSARALVDDALAGVAVTWELGDTDARIDGTDVQFGTDARLDDTVAADTTTLVEACENGWWYSALLPGGRGIAVWMSDTDLIRAGGLRDGARWTAALEATHETRRRFERARPAGPPVVRSARSQRLAPVCGEGWIAAGDAACAFDPLSSAGILKALRSGKLAAFATLDALAGDASGTVRYAHLVEREYADYLAARQAFYARELRWPQAAFWARRAKRVS